MSLVRKHLPPTRALIQFVTSLSSVNASAKFRVPIPDSRLRVKLSLLFVLPGTANNFDISPGLAKLWLYEAEDEMASGLGRAQQVNNLQVNGVTSTETAPVLITPTAGILGYSREFVTASDAIEGVLTAQNPGQFGNWVLQARYQPSDVRFNDEEWEAIISECNPQLLTGPVSL